MSAHNETALTQDEMVVLLKKMLLLRYFESAAKDSFLNTSIIGACHVYLGEEATAAGICAVLEKNDYIVSTHRGHGHCLAKGADAKWLMAELFGKTTGYCRGRGGSMHIYIKELGVLCTNGIVGAGLPLSLGAAMHAKLSKTGRVAVCFFGDGAANQGTFHESLNLAAIQRLPVIFVCENNLYATATKVPEATLTEHFADRAPAYHIPGQTIDGNDVLEVYHHAQTAIARARAGEGPTLLECLTYRHLGHFVGESTDYRSKEELDQWLQKDPIRRYKKYLLDHGYLPSAAIDDLESEVKQEIEAAVAFATASPYPDVNEIEEHVFVHEGV